MCNSIKRIDGRDYGYKVLQTMALAKNYNYYIFKRILPYIKGKVLEIGPGTGNITYYLNNHCEFLSGIDKSLTFIKHLQIDYPDINFYHGDISDSEIIKSIGEEEFDTAVCLNVLEHIENDSIALKNIYKLLKKGGKLILFVPALSCLYGSIDKNLGHYRRYNKKDLSEKLLKSGFQIEKIVYNNIVGMLGWYINSKILKRKTFSIIQPILFDKFVPIVLKIDDKIGAPFGMSLLAAGTKK